MKLHRLTFSHEALLKLPKEEQLFFLRLANVRDDLRSLDAFCLGASNGLSSRNKVRREVAAHQLLFGIRLLCGTLHEAWNVINSGWNQTTLGRHFSPRVPRNAKDALRVLKKYFGRRNIVTKIRNEFAFHYDTAALEAVLPKLASSTQHVIITGRSAGNVFYSFAEHVRNIAMILAGEKPFGQEAFRQLHAEPHHVYEQFAVFSDAVLLEIATSLRVSKHVVSVGRGYKVSKLRAPTFVDEASLESL